MQNSFDKSDLTNWVKSYTQELFAWAIQKTGDRQLSEDLVQDTFLIAAEKITTFKKDSQPKTWLIGILKNKIADHYRKVMRKNQVFNDASDPFSLFFNSHGSWIKSAMPQMWDNEPAHLLDNPTFNKTLDGCIENLPKMMGACIRLKFLAEKKAQLICQELGITDTNYWQLIRRAKLHLRSCLETNWFNSN
ncbi:MAG: sigma-70 family RNA polymerase sigma factor [Bacteroidota bacterium]